MKKFVVCAALLLAATPAFATLKVGDKAPDFSAPATLGGKEFTFHLADALKKGPVVVYFYPAAFSEGCTVEAHDFAAAMPQYQALGASVIGVSHDDIATLKDGHYQTSWPAGLLDSHKTRSAGGAALGLHCASRSASVVLLDISILTPVVFITCCQWRSRMAGLCSRPTALNDVIMFLTLLSMPLKADG